MIIFWRILLALGLMLIGLALGAWTGSQFFVTKADGMVGGVMVLWYGVLGAIILLVIGIFLGLRLKGKALPILALFFILIASVYYGVAILKAGKKFRDEAGSNSAYAIAGKFTVSMERLDLSDPFLFVKMKIDSRTRHWVQIGPAPKNEAFTASLRAKQLVEIRQALNDMVELPAKVFADCNSDQGPGTKQLRWHLSDAEISSEGPSLAKKGVVNINDACLREYLLIARVLQLVEKASQSPLGDIKRQ